MEPVSYLLNSIVRFACLAVLIGVHPGMVNAYEPLALQQTDSIPHTLDLSVNDQVRQRTIPVKVYLPSTSAPAPVILFSHGLGGSREGSAYLGTHWAARGYVAVFLQHPGSDETVWRNKPMHQRLRALQQAANAQNFLLRAKDVSVVLDQLAIWQTSSDHAVAGRLDMTRIGMSGYSFGAVTTQAVSGQQFGSAATSLTDPRIKAAIIFSPSGPRRGNNAAAFGKVSIPWLLMTGTKDVAAIGGIDLQSRLSVFPALPPGNKYELVLNGAEHAAFGDRTAGVKRRNPHHHRAILAVSTAFWDAYLRKDAAAKDWLDGAGPRSILEPEDRWQQK
jgi:dienelactone hydrolase